MKKVHQILLDELEEVVLPTAVVMYSSGIVVVYGRDVVTIRPLTGNINNQLDVIADGLKFRQN